MVEKEAYAVLNWPHTGKGNSGDEWLAFRCPTPGCPSEGVSRNRDHDFGRCGICGAIMEAVAPASTHPRAKQKTSTTPPTAKPAKPAKEFDVPKEIASAQKLGEQLEELVVKRGQCPDDERNILLMGYWSLIFDFHKAILPKSGVKFALFVQMWPKIDGLDPRFMQQSIKLHKTRFSSPAVLTDELGAVSCRSTQQ